MKYKAPEAHNGPFEGTSTTKLSNLRSIRHLRASQGYLLGLLANLFLDFRAHTLPLPLKQPKTEVSCEQFGQPGGREVLSEQRKLTSLSPMVAPGFQVHRNRYPTAPSVDSDIPRSLVSPMERP